MSGTRAIEYRSRFPVDDGELSRLHAGGFGARPVVLPWAARLTRFSVSWVGAFVDDELVGFVHAVWDGGLHAFLLDTVVRQDLRRSGIGVALVRAVTDDARRAGCEWLHVDHEAALRPFYEQACGFRPTAAGLIRL